MSRPATLSGGPRLAAALALVLVVAAVLVAVLGSGGRGSLLHPRARAGGRPAALRSDVAIAALYLGTSTSALRAELRSGRSLADVAAHTKGRTAAGVEHAILGERERALAAQSRLTAAQRRARLRVLRLRVARRVHVSRPFALGPVNLETAAHYLGARPDELRSELARGRTLAAIASSTPGRSTTGLLDALLRSRRASLERSQHAGSITAAQAQQRLAALRARVETVIHRAHG
ncbi:MAG TPA: hypothetical protein VFW29_06010 [Solirubrobacteraceae bacterium]|nr:hypothetical protein [Solirubrobacteraceae bacterium]